MIHGVKRKKKMNIYRNRLTFFYMVPVPVPFVNLIRNDFKNVLKMCFFVVAGTWEESQNIKLPSSPTVG